MEQKCKRLLAFVVAVVTIATTGSSGAAPMSALTANAQVSTPQTIGASSGPVISGTVLRRGSRATVADVPLRLRNLDSGAIVGQTTSDKNGNYSFPLPAPGRYLVEAVTDDGRVLAVGNELNLAGAAVVADVILPSGALLALLVLGIAGSAGVAAWTVASLTGSANTGPTVVSPER